ncbi:MAG: AAA family ATPase [Hyphomicrobiales bacterium]|nr:AAA family ATPase [Hyphomicrobiales bacterium]
MRIARLDLTRYGKFTDKIIDFGPRVSGEPDLHILFGPNESGKTTTLTAYLDLLYGIEVPKGEKRSRYSFRHPEATMRVGALLENEGVARGFARMKNGLLGENDQPISEGVLSAELGGLDRAAYRAMFSLDDETIESGGDSILQSKGDLGQLLFSASAGLADLSRQLAAIRDEAGRFYKYRAHSGELHDLKKELTRLKDERAKVDTLASQFAQLISVRDSAKNLYDAAAKENGRIRLRLDEIGRVLSVLPRLVGLQRLREQLENLQALPGAPIGALDELKVLQRDEVDLAARLETAKGEVDRLRVARDGSAPEQAAFELSPLLDALGILRARHVAAIEDIPKRQLELRDLDHAVAGILERLGRPDESDPKRLVMPAPVAARLRALIEDKAKVDARSISAAEEVEGAQERLTEATEKHRLAGGANSSSDQAAQIAALGATVAAIREGDAVVARTTAKRELETAEADLQEKLQALQPWSGTADELLQFPAPDKSVVARWKSEISSAQKKSDRSAGDVERLDKERLRLEAELSELGRSTGIVDDAEAGRIRSDRNDAWDVHRAALDRTSADAFEALLRRDDETTQARFSHTTELSELRQAGLVRAKVHAELEHARSALAEARDALSVLLADMVATFGALKLKAADEHAIGQIEAWLRMRDEALKARVRVLSARRSIDEAKGSIERACARLVKALTACGVSQDADASIEELTNAAEAVLSDYQKSSALREEIENCRKELSKRESAQRKAIAAQADWAQSWSAACNACWIGDANRLPSVDDMREALNPIAELSPTLEKQAGLVDRIEKMKKDQAEFADEIAQHSATLAIEATDNVLAAYAAIEARVQAARTAADLRAKRVEDLETAEETHREMVKKQTVHEKRKAALLDALGASSLSIASDVLDKIAKRGELLSQAADATNEILDAMNVATIAEAEAVLGGLDRSALESERSELAIRQESESERLQRLFADLSKAVEKIESVGGDETVAQLEERRRTILLQIEDGAQRYLRLRLGAVAAEQALRIYRDKHRSTMMSRASEAFKTISRGAYQNLVAQPEKDGDVLVAIAAEGGSKLAHELSKGARFQLYLALRIAGYHEFGSNRRPVPFIADDIMETFDDDRSAEALSLFAEIAQFGQVIYMTHHKHLCDLARKVCPSVKVHELA